MKWYWIVLISLAALVVGVLIGKASNKGANSPVTPGTTTTSSTTTSTITEPTGSNLAPTNTGGVNV